MTPRNSSASYGVRTFATLLICRYRVNSGRTASSLAYRQMSGDTREQEDVALNVQPLDPAPPRPNIFSWVKWVLGSILPLLFSFWKQNWDNMLKLEGKVEEVAKEVEEVAEVVEKVASTTEKMSAEVAEKLDNGELKQVALMVEHASTIIANDARMTEEFIDKVGDLKQDITDLENMVDRVIDKTKNMKIKIQSSQFIRPSKSTPENLSKFKLSLLDQLAPFSHINLVFYYKASGEVNISDRYGQLVKSLSEALTLYYPLAGIITEDGLVVDCNDQGVNYIETRVNTRLSDFLEQGPKIEHVRKLIGAPDQVTTTLITIQVNVFECGGVVIGVSASHKVNDACNLVRFINEWASTNRTGISNGAYAPSFDNLALSFPPKKSSSLKHSPIKVDQKALVVTKRFVFNETTISKLRKKAGSINRKYSRVTLVAALIWKALISVDQVKSGTIRDCLLAPAMNLRGKAGSPVSERSFGNVWFPYPIRFLPNTMESKYADLVALIEDTTRTVVMQLSEASAEEISRRAIACYAEVDIELKQNKFCIFSSWCRFPVYEADFGWGKPDWASDADSSLEAVTLMDEKDGTGIEAWVNLNEKDMEQEDAALDVQPSDAAPPRPNIFSWVKWVLGSILPLLFSFWKQNWDSMLKLEGKVEEVAKEVEEVAEVVEKVASTTEKMSAEVAEKLDNGELKQVALMVEHASTIIANDARMTEEFIHKVGDLKQDITDLENMVDRVIDKTKK
ncbi:Chloramphenicol acetyltransferase-like domain-containing protein [Artemisia annua]|uniref:Chloramphenicol acetyltransferase-like domain-containing protein n=1 Tax=Artemisia annua TaxID=35608 RepID=A0A2U1NHB8_ARTAN|nr:Chloramphenicol acetyltransferase-like domain-containing protein [Artemisia annua]